MYTLQNFLRNLIVKEFSADISPPLTIVSDIAIFVLKRDIKTLTFYRLRPHHFAIFMSFTVGIWLAYKLKPHPYEQQCRSNIVECYKSNDSFDKVECCFDIAAGVDGDLRLYVT